MLLGKTLPGHLKLQKFGNNTLTYSTSLWHSRTRRFFFRCMVDSCVEVVTKTMRKCSLKANNLWTTGQNRVWMVYPIYPISYRLDVLSQTWAGIKSCPCWCRCSEWASNSFEEFFILVEPHIRSSYGCARGHQGYSKRDKMLVTLYFLAHTPTLRRCLPCLAFPTQPYVFLYSIPQHVRWSKCCASTQTRSKWDFLGPWTHCKRLR